MTETCRLDANDDNMRAEAIMRAQVCANAVELEIMRGYNALAMRLVIFDYTTPTVGHGADDVLWAQTYVQRDVELTPALEYMLEGMIDESKRYLDFLVTYNKVSCGRHFIGGGEEVRGWLNHSPGKFQRPTKKRDKSLLLGGASSIEGAFFDAVVGIGGMFTFPDFGAPSVAQSCKKAGTSVALDVLLSQYGADVKPAQSI